MYPPRIISSYLLIFTGWGINAGKGVINPAWYLCVLILCYILFYVIKLIGRGRHWLRVSLYILTAAASVALEQLKLGENLPFIGNTNVRGYGCFFIGVLIFEFTQCVKSRNVRVTAAGAAIALYILLSLRYGGDHWQTLELLLFPGLVLLAVSVGQIPCRALSYFGGVSFEVYLWHIPLIRLAILITSLLGVTIQHSYLTMILFAVIVECVAAVVYTYFEVPLSRLLARKTGGR